MAASHALAGLVAAFSIAAAQAATYQVTDVAASQAFHMGINRSGAVTSTLGIDGVDYAFVFENGSLRLLEAAGQYNSGNAINDRGDVAGTCQGPQARRPKACIWTTAGLRKFKGLLGGGMVTVEGINEARQVVGSSDAGLGRVHPYRYDHGVMIDLGTLGGNDSRAFAINRAGHVAGYSLVAGNQIHYHAFIHDGAQLKDLGTLSGGSSFAYALNDADVAVGASDLDDGRRHAVIFDGGRVTDLGTLGGSSSAARAINNHGVVVGWSDTPTYRHQRAFIYRNGHMTPLTHHLDPVSGAGWTLTNAGAINDAGQIVAQGYRGEDTQDAHTLLLTPID
ncbi:DUF3466 family protein [Ideonella sp.]|uniref:DUF3466 family protein n=1 Tax=Ideonella sp. TaxID=1929293 RepID=UPI0035AFBE3F